MQTLRQKITFIEMPIVGLRQLTPADEPGGVCAQASGNKSADRQLTFQHLGVLFG